MKARILFPLGNYSGNLLWSRTDFSGKDALLKISMDRLVKKGYWASAFPERDGVAFSDHENARTESEVLEDFQACFDWLEISKGATGDANLELAELEQDSIIRCIVIVPLTKIHFEQSFDVDGYEFVCQKDFDPSPFERLGDFKGAYLQFEPSLLYKDVLRVNKSMDHNDVVIRKCMALAEHAMDIIRYQFSSFEFPEKTPNPAGQLDDGTYAIEIVPLGNTHLKPISLRGISLPMSVSNNWLGPEVFDRKSPIRDYLSEVMRGRDDELALGVKSALRACRQSFYAVGDESRFLNLVFALDGLAEPGKWQGWKHRSYIAALLSKGLASDFVTVLKRYDGLYSDVRNRLVHGGVDFYELPHDPQQACSDMHSYIVEVVELIQTNNFQTVADLHRYATDLLRRPSFASAYTSLISAIGNARGKPQQVPSW